jgi:hypothetical protein
MLSLDDIQVESASLLRSNSHQKSYPLIDALISIPFISLEPVRLCCGIGVICCWFSRLDENEKEKPNSSDGPAVATTTGGIGNVGVDDGPAPPSLDPDVKRTIRLLEKKYD